jgi:hypothetical protein
MKNSLPARIWAYIGPVQTLEEYKTLQNILPERTAAVFSNGRMFFIFANEI